LKLEHMSLTELARRAVDLAQSQLRGRGLKDRIKVDLDAPLDDFQVSVDGAQIEDALLNLIINAIEAIDGSGQVQMSIRRAESADEELRDEAVIAVRDNGRGISEEDLARIFNPFFTTTQGGTGLGLPAVRRIVRLHGGRVDVTSQPGEGSTFTIYLPIT